MRKHKRKMLKIYARKVIKIPAWTTKIHVFYNIKEPEITLKIGDSKGVETNGYNI